MKLRREGSLKYFNFIFIFCIIFILSFCKSNQSVDSSYVFNESEGIDELLFDEEPLIEIFEEEFEEVTDIIDIEDFDNIEEITEEIFEEIIEEIIEEIVDIDITDDNLADIEYEEELIADEPDIDEYIETELPQEIVTPQPSPQAETQPVQPPVQITQPPVQPVQPPPTQPPVQPVQPPAQTTPLQPAEEPAPIINEESGSYQPPRQPLRDAFADAEARDRPVTTGQSLLVPQEGDIVFSRIVRATVGQTIEIPFYGSGWVYLGELASRRGIVYNSRRLDPDGQSFIFRAEEAGTYVLKFFRQDFIRDYILNDHVQIIVGEAPSSEGAGWFNPPIDRGRVVAQPRWPSSSEESQIQRSTPAASSQVPPPAVSEERETSSVSVTPGTSDQLPVQPAAASPLTPETAQPEDRQVIPPDVLLQRAKDTFEAGNVAAAITLLDQYAQYYSAGTDELYWLYGQFYEANSPARNILLSLEYYRRLVREYPQSTRFNDTRRRIAYLERFYINIR